MTEARPQFRLRSYLMAFFIPLTGLPLLVLALLTYLLVGRALDQETALRSRSELSAAARNLDTVEKRLVKEISEFSRRRDVQGASLMESSSLLNSSLKSYLANSFFERVRVYSASGEFLYEGRQKERKKFDESWNAFFSGRQAKPKDRTASLDQEEGREPAAARLAQASPFVHPESRFDLATNRHLKTDFRNFLRGEDPWVVHELSANGSIFEENRPQVEAVVYKVILDSDFKVAGFLEGRVPLDNSKLAMLSQFQGVDLLLISPEFESLSSSAQSLASQVASNLLTYRRAGKSSDLRHVTREVNVKSEPVALFFAPLTNDSADPVAWIGVGLDKGSQVTLRKQILLWIALMASVLAGIVVVLTVRISNQLTQPVSDLVVAAEAVKQGEWVHPLEADSRTEIGFLVRRFNEMAQSVQSAKVLLETKLEELATAHGALTQTQDQLVQSAKMSSLGQLVAGVAHELNNPIAFIYSNMAQMKLHLRSLERLDEMLDELESKLKKSDAEKLEQGLDEIEWDYVRKDMTDMVQSCLEGSIRVKDIVLGLRNFSRLDKGEIAMSDIHEALQNTAKLLVGQMKNRVQLHWSLALDGRLECNLAQMNQVFMNLLANAAQAIPERGEVWIKTWISTEDSKEYLNVSIRDNGRGIAPEDLKKIFDPFFTTKKVGEGTGLGLSIVYGIIERHRGTIQVRSQVFPEDRHGTEFTLRLPRLAHRENSDETDVDEDDLKAS